MLVARAIVEWFESYVCRIEWFQVFANDLVVNQARKIFVSHVSLSRRLTATVKYESGRIKYRVCGNLLVVV